MMIRLTQLDGRLPNLALMKLAAYHRQRGAEVFFTRSPYRGFDDADRAYDVVYGSAIFSFTAERVATLKREFPGAIVGGTWDTSNPVTVEDLIGPFEPIDYSDYPQFTASLGFTQRGCRFKCGFCVVPKKEGAPRPVMTIGDIWRGPRYPKHLHLLDNDFFGQPEAEWRARLDEIRRGAFKVCFNQGINIRMIDDRSAEALATIDYRDDSFSKKRIYTAWDNLGDEARFFRGIDCLERHGIPAKHVMAYMLVGYDRRETWERVLHRFKRMTERGIRPYPMLFKPIENRYKQLLAGDHACEVIVRRKLTLGDFDRWANGRYYNVCDFSDYHGSIKGLRSRAQLQLL